MKKGKKCRTLIELELNRLIKTNQITIHKAQNGQTFYKPVKSYPHVRNHLLRRQRAR